MKKYDSLKLENQLCFPRYAAGKEIVRKYHPVLEKLNITYTQYITLLVLWEQDGLSVKELGKKLYLDSGTLTPLLKALETKGFVKRVRNSRDERLVEVFLTDDGRALREEALSVPLQVGQCVALSKDEAMQLYSLLYKLLGNLTNEGDNNE